MTYMREETLWIGRNTQNKNKVWMYIHSEMKTNH